MWEKYIYIWKKAGFRARKMKMNEAIQFERKALKLSLSMSLCCRRSSSYLEPLYVCSQQHCHCHGKSFSATDFPLLFLFARERVSSCDNFIIYRICPVYHRGILLGKWNIQTISLLWDARFPSHLMMSSTEHVENSKCRNEKFLVLFHFHCSLCGAWATWVNSLLFSFSLKLYFFDIFHHFSPYWRNRNITWTVTYTFETKLQTPTQIWSNFEVKRKRPKKSRHSQVRYIPKIIKKSFKIRQREAEKKQERRKEKIFTRARLLLLQFFTSWQINLTVFSLSIYEEKYLSKRNSLPQHLLIKMEDSSWRENPWDGGSCCATVGPNWWWMVVMTITRIRSTWDRYYLLRSIHSDPTLMPYFLMVSLGRIVQNWNVTLHTWYKSSCFPEIELNCENENIEALCKIIQHCVWKTKVVSAW